MKILIYVLIILSAISLIVGIIGRFTGFFIIGVLPVTYLRVAGVLLLFAIALELLPRKE